MINLFWVYFCYYSSTSTAVNWWERSPNYNNTNNFCNVNNNGNANNNNANNLSLSFKHEKSTENNWIWKEKFYEASPEDLRKVLKLIERKIYSNEQF